MKFFISFSLILILVACSSDDIVQKRRFPEKELKEALVKLKDDDLIEAKNELYALTIKYAGTKTAEEAQYYLGETQYKMEKYLLAADAYRRVHERYTQSSYREKAQYKEALSFEKLSPSFALDQKFTKTAIKKYKDFIADYPKSEFRENVERSLYDLNDKLAHKLYHSAYIYYKMEQWRSALRYTDLVKKEFDNTSYIEKAYLLRVKVFIEKEQWVQAEQEIEVFRNRFPEKADKNLELNELKKEISEGKEDVLNG